MKILTIKWYKIILVFSILVKISSSSICEDCNCSESVVDCRKSHFIPRENITIDGQKTEAYFSGISIDSIGPNTFECQNCSVELLDLSANNIESVPGWTFKLINTLTILKLRNNKISVLKNNSFKDLLDLTILDLGFNKIEHLPSDLLNELPNLSELDLRYNEIAHIPDTFFIATKNLITLDISHLRLETLPNDIFQWNSSIKFLDISHNLFGYVPTNTLSKLGDSLQTLKMSGNRIKTLQNGAFKGLRNVNFIKMEQLLNLHYIEAYAFAGLESLENVELRYLPKIVTFDEKAFNLQENNDNGTVTYCPLYDFTLCFSSLPYLPPNLLDWSITRQIMLRNNQWNCNCTMKWIKNSTVENKTGASMYCTYPSLLRGANVVSLDKEDFTCNRNTTMHNNSGGIVVVIFIFIVGLMVSTATVMILVYRRNGWIIRRPKGFNLLGNEIITVFDRTEQLSTISKTEHSTLQIDSQLPNNRSQ